MFSIIISNVLNSFLKITFEIIKLQNAKQSM